MGIAYNTSIVRNGLVLHLDAANTKSYTGSGTAWKDLSGNGNNGTLVNGPTYNSNNKGSLAFDGTNDYVSFNSSTQSLGLNSSNGASMCCWMNLTLLSRWTGVFTFWGAVGICDLGWDIQPDNKLRMWKGSASSAVSLDPYNNSWAYYSLVSNASGVIFYINGSQFATAALTGNVPYTAGRTLMFGDHWDNSIQANASSLHIYNRALSASEVKQNFEALRGRYDI